jgi:hypothetical protein
MPKQLGWRGAPDDPPEFAPQLQVEISDDRLRLVEGGDAWISAAAVLSLEDCR